MKDEQAFNMMLSHRIESCLVFHHDDALLCFNGTDCVEAPGSITCEKIAFEVAQRLGMKDKTASNPQLPGALLMTYQVALPQHRLP